MVGRFFDDILTLYSATPPLLFLEILAVLYSGCYAILSNHTQLLTPKITELFSSRPDIIKNQCQQAKPPYHLRLAILYLGCIADPTKVEQDKVMSKKEVFQSTISISTVFSSSLLSITIAPFSEFISLVGGTNFAFDSGQRQELKAILERYISGSPPTIQVLRDVSSFLLLRTADNCLKEHSWMNGILIEQLLYPSIKILDARVPLNDRNECIRTMER